MRVLPFILLTVCTRITVVAPPPEAVPRTEARPGVAVASGPDGPAAASAAAAGCPPAPAPEFVPLPDKAVAIAARQAHACAVLETGRVWCWGNNDFEQAGSTHRATQMAPQDIGLDHVVEVSLGYSSGCARHADGTTTCWGRKTSWNPSLPQSMAARVPAGRKVSRVSAGHDHTCAIVRGAVECYGSLGNFAGFPVKQPVVPGIAGATAIAAGMDHDCALAGGAVACWGLPWRWSCGVECERDRQRPVGHRVPGIADATAIAIGSFDACAVRRNGHVACWGSVNGATDGLESPIEIAGLDDVRQVANGDHHACAVRRNGQIACWGYGGAGARGDGRTDERGEQPATVAGIDSAIAVAAGLHTSCALLADGRVTCWGMNDHGQLGFATRTRSDAPVEVCGLDRVTALVAMESTTCALRADRTVACWGAGWPRHGNTAAPTLVPGVSDVVQLVAGHGTFCGRDGDGSVTCWGAPIEPNLSDPVRHLALGRFGLCAVRVDGSVVCQGKLVSGIDRATRVAVGDDLACAANDREVMCWGPSTFPPLPPGDHHPVAVDSGPRRSGLSEDIIDLAALPWGYCALTRDGRAHCGHSYELLRDGPPDPSDNPWSTKTPTNLPGVRQVVKGRDHACARRADGHVVCWGDNQFGQLGIGISGLVAAPAH